MICTGYSIVTCKGRHSFQYKVNVFMSIFKPLQKISLSNWGFLYFEFSDCFLFNFEDFLKSESVFFSSTGFLVSPDPTACSSLQDQFSYSSKYEEKWEETFVFYMFRHGRGLLIPLGYLHPGKRKALTNC